MIKKCQNGKKIFCHKTATIGHEIDFVIKQSLFGDESFFSDIVQQLFVTKRIIGDKKILK